jgi:hypothetical protein
MRLEDLVALRSRIAESFQQATRVAPDAIRIGDRPSVECDSHLLLVPFSSSPMFTAPPTYSL